MNAGEEPIADDEILYRRIPEGWCNGNEVEDQAFLPHKKSDQDGLSLSRAKYKTAQEAAYTSRHEKRYYVAVLRVSKLRADGIRIQPMPLADDPGHCVLPDLTSGNRGTNETRQKALSLALSLRSDDIEGPFGPSA